MKTAIIIPTYNEVGNISKLIDRIFAIEPAASVIIVDSHSNDGTIDTVKEYALRNPLVKFILGAPYVGYNQRGDAVKLGWKEAVAQNADIIIEMDADMSHHPERLPSFIKACQSADVVIGSRYVTGGGSANREMTRSGMSFYANLLVRVRLGLKDILDCTSGYRGYTKKALLKIGIENMKTSEGTSTLLEFLYKARKSGLSIVEIPIEYTKRESGSSKFNWKVIRDALKYVFIIR